jgi:putative acetyltransferase
VDVVGLGPLGVRPEQQGRGVGQALVHAVVAAADALDLPLAVLLGSPGYYRRFGFVPGSELGVQAPDPAWGEHFQARPLGTYRGERGPFAYAAPFADL